MNISFIYVKEFSLSPNFNTAPFSLQKHDGLEKMDTSEPPTVELHPRKRKLKSAKEAASASSSAGTSSASGSEKEKEREREAAEPVPSGSSSNTPQNDPPPMMNCYEMWFNIRKQVSVLF